MKKNITINLFGTLYAIDEDAYELLQNYLDEMKNYFKRQEGGDEIVDDIEHRVAELLWELKNSGVEAIYIDQVKDIIKKIGNPQDLDSQEGSESSQKQQFADEGNDTGSLLDRYLKSLKGRRLYRDTNDKILGGVCSGITKYLGGTDPLPLRLIIVLLALFVNFDYLSFFWISTITYLILWAVMPVPASPEDRLRMEGKKVTPENLKNQILNDAAEKDASVQVRQSTASGCLGTFLKVIIFCFLAFWGIILLIPLFALIVAGVATIAALLGVGSSEILFEGDQQFLQFLKDNSWLVTTGIVSGILAIVIPLYGILHAMFSSKNMSGKQIVTLLVIWILSLGIGLGMLVYGAANLEAFREKYPGLALESSPMITQPYDFKNFTDIELSENIELYYTQADTFDVQAEAREKILNHADIRLEGYTLRCEGYYLNGKRIKDSDSKIKLYVTAPTLEKIHAQGSCLIIADSVNQHSLDMHLQGASQIDVKKISVDEMDLKCEGATYLKDLYVEAQDFKLDAEGAARGKVTMKGGSCQIKSEGASQLEVDVNCDSLKVDSKGASKINITGKAKTKVINNDGVSKISTVDLITEQQ